MKDNNLESTFQKKIMKIAIERGLMVRAVQWRGRKGCPDIVVMGEGHCAWVELKRPNGNGVVAPHQKREIDRMRQHDISAHVIDSYDDFSELLTFEFPDHSS